MCHSYNDKIVQNHGYCGIVWCGITDAEMAVKQSNREVSSQPASSPYSVHSYGSYEKPVATVHSPAALPYHPEPYHPEPYHAPQPYHAPEPHHAVAHHAAHLAPVAHHAVAHHAVAHHTMAHHAPAVNVPVVHTPAYHAPKPAYHVPVPPYRLPLDTLVWDTQDLATTV